MWQVVIFFGLSNNLETHFEIIHGGVKYFKCDKCVIWFGLKNESQEHMKIIHDVVEYFSCVQCDEC